MSGRDYGEHCEQAHALFEFYAGVAQDLDFDAVVPVMAASQLIAYMACNGHSLERTIDLIRELYRKRTSDLAREAVQGGAS